MSERELRRAAVLAQVKSGTWTLVEAAERMDLNYRQAKRLWKRYRRTLQDELDNCDPHREHVWEDAADSDANKI